MERRCRFVVLGVGELDLANGDAAEFQSSHWPTPRKSGGFGRRRPKLRRP